MLPVIEIYLQNENLLPLWSIFLISIIWFIGDNDPDINCDPLKGVWGPFAFQNRDLWKKVFYMFHFSNENQFLQSCRKSGKLSKT